MPVEIVRILQVRISRRPWPRSVSRVASGTARQGSAVSWACRWGWLALTVRIQCAPRSAR